VQRVDDRTSLTLPPQISGFSTRRINFTFRFVPDRHILPFAKLGQTAQGDVRGYLEQLAQGSPFFRRALEAAGKRAAAP
jgi:alkylated DNA repair protein (DNA oxidative demethylase)